MRWTTAHLLIQKGIVRDYCNWEKLMLSVSVQDISLRKSGPVAGIEDPAKCPL